MRKLGYYTPHFVNWTASAANARMPLLHYLEGRHELVLMRRKHQRMSSPNGHVDLRRYSQLNLEHEWLSKCTDPPLDGESRTDAWMRHNLATVKFDWPEIDALVVEPFCVFPSNQLFQMALLAHYAPRVPVTMYDMDFMHGTNLLGRMAKFVEVPSGIIGVTHTEKPIYPGLPVGQVFLPLGPWSEWQSRKPAENPAVDLIFIGRDLSRKGRMQELVLEPARHGLRVRVHGDLYRDDFKAKHPLVEWLPPVPRDAMSDALRDAYCTVVILQTPQQKAGFYPLRFAASAIGGAIQLVDAKIVGGERFAVPGTLVTTNEDVVRFVAWVKERGYSARSTLHGLQLELFAWCKDDGWNVAFESIVERRWDAYDDFALRHIPMAVPRPRGAGDGGQARGAPG